jgi:peptide/nickel transport system substrate-binding protein
MKRLKSRITLLLLMAGLVFLGVLVFHRPVGLKPGPANIQPSPRSSDADTLRLLYSRSALTLNPHLATGFQDFEAARLVYEPLASYNQAGELTPVLAKDIPTQANGGVGENGATVTWELRPEVKWSDGQAFTADDVVFTFEFIHNPEVAAVTAQYYEAIKQVEALDDYRVKITFNQTDPAWATVFTGQTGLILPRHIFAQYNNGQARAATPNLQPVGTGPYQVVGFQTGTIIFEPNPTHWAGKPGFKRVEWLGGMAPYAAARDVLRAGTADVAPNLQVEATGLRDLEKDGKGHVVNLFGAQVERIMVNFANPFAQTEQGERSSATLPHPYFSDWRVRQAVNLAVDRNTISRDLYGAAGQPTAQVLVAPIATRCLT